MPTLLSMIGAAATLAVLDIAWVGFLMNNFYNAHVGHLRGPIVWGGAIGFYVVYTFGVWYFAIHGQASVTTAAISGALLGLVAYGVYNFTNHATLANWPLTVVIVDTLWGIALTATVAVAGYTLGQLV